MGDLLRKSVLAVAMSSVLLGLGCAPEPMTGVDPVDGKDDAWNSENDPANFGGDMDYSWENLRKPELAHGASAIVPWPDTYWPMQQDGYNDRWQGQSKLSPVELYDKAFNAWTPDEGFMNLKPFSSPGTAYDKDYYAKLGPAARWGHERGGNHQVMNGQDDDDNGQVDDGWDGMEGWWGHCHAWAPAAMSAPEPQHAVELDGVRFEVADIKALIEATYEGTGSVFLGGRCNLKEINRDEHGRITDTECRDTNAGSFHVVTVNVMGRHRKSFVIDATYSYQVWNQPVRDYTIEKQDEVDLAAALTLLGWTDNQPTAYPYNPDAKRFVHVITNLRYVVEGSASTEAYLSRIDSYTRTARYEYLLELTADGEIIGGEWIDADPHPDFMWAPKGSADVRSGGYWGNVVISRDQVQKLIDLSTGADEPVVGATEHPYSSTGSISIPDDDETGVASTISVPDSLTISGLRVEVSITHSYIGDLKVELERNGQVVSLSANEGGSADNLVKTFTVGDFNGSSATGDWTLLVRDTAAQDVGTLDSWRLIVLAQ